MGFFESEDEKLEKLREKEERARKREEMRERLHVEQKHSRPVTVLLWCLKYGFIFLCVFFFVFAMIRIFLMKAPGEFKHFTVTDTARAAYETQGDALVIEEQPLFSYITPSGLFHGQYVYVIPDADELQISVWYSDSTVEKLQREYPDTADLAQKLCFLLADDNGTLYEPKTENTAHRGGYTYFRFTYDGVDFSATEDLNLRFYLGEEQIRYEDRPVELLVYRASYQRQPVAASDAFAN